MRWNSNTHNSWMVTLPVAIGGIAYLLLGFFPGMRAIGERHRELQVRQDYIVQAGKLRPAIEQAQRDLEQTLAYNAQWQQNAPSTGTSAFFGKIHQQAASQGIQTTRFEPQPKVEFETLRKTPLLLGASANFVQICQLLAELEQNPATVWIDSIQFKAASENEKLSTCELRLAIFTGNSGKSD